MPKPPNYAPTRKIVLGKFQINGIANEQLNSLDTHLTRRCHYYCVRLVAIQRHLELMTFQNFCNGAEMVNSHTLLVLQFFDARG